MLDPIAYLPGTTLEVEKVCSCGYLYGCGYNGCECSAIGAGGGHPPAAI